MARIKYILFLLGLLSQFTLARPLGPADCADMEVWDYSMGMCMPRAMAGMPMSMTMINFNSFFAATAESGPRGRGAVSVPDFFMGDVGTTIGARHYLNLDVMGTVERWTFPEAGEPEFLQIGENQSNGQPYLDSQHPHSSPVMGITLSDTISIGAKKDYVKVWFSPRGQSTDGPIAFMHRSTGMMNPDAPLGHHVGQDVGHITSTVVGLATQIQDTTLEVSAFNGTEPLPWKVDLPMATLNSYAFRVTQRFGPEVYAMGSIAFVKSPEPMDPNLDHVWRYSASIYEDGEFNNGWMFHNALIWGLINFYDQAAALNSFGEEFWINRDAMNLWGRFEVLQRTPAELAITSSTPNDPEWVFALTLGYTHRVAHWEAADVSVGASVTEDFLPAVFQSAYGGSPFSGKVFVQFGGMKMWDL